MKTKTEKAIERQLDKLDLLASHLEGKGHPATAFDIKDCVARIQSAMIRENRSTAEDFEQGEGY